MLGPACDLHTAAEQLHSILEGRNLEPGQLLFDVGDPADNFCIVQSGSVRGEVSCPDSTICCHRPVIGAWCCVVDLLLLWGMC